MNSPRIDLPFFAYGLFKPGQLGFLRLRDLVKHSEPDCALQGTLLERDGLPIVDEEGMGTVKDEAGPMKRHSSQACENKLREEEPSIEPIDRGKARI